MQLCDTPFRHGVTSSADYNILQLIDGISRCTLHTSCLRLRQCHISALERRANTRSNKRTNNTPCGPNLSHTSSDLHVASSTGNSDVVKKLSR